MIKLSEHISYKEATRSETAIRYGLDNTPDEETLSNMMLLAEKVFEPARKHFEVPLYISSFYRSLEVNAKIGGSPTSQHCFGKAIDIDCDVFGEITNLQLLYWIKDNLEFDQLIWEFDNPDGSPAWVHVSYNKDNNRNECLRAYKIKGETKYEKII